VGIVIEKVIGVLEMNITDRANEFLREVLTNEGATGIRIYFAGIG
jgi:hypothetical protein